MSKVTSAWLVPVSANHSIALGVHQFQEIVFRPSITKNDAMPIHLQHSIYWRNRAIPILDTQYITEGKSQIVAGERDISFSVFAYTHDFDEDIQYVALPVIIDPRMIDVKDEEICDLPNSLSNWQNYTLSCFKYVNDPVPIINLGCIVE